MPLTEAQEEKKRKNIKKTPNPYQVHISSPYQMLECSGWSSDTENQKLVAARDPIYSVMLDRSSNWDTEKQYL